MVSSRDSVQDCSAIKSVFECLFRRTSAGSKKLHPRFEILNDSSGASLHTYPIFKVLAILNFSNILKSVRYYCRELSILWTDQYLTYVCCVWQIEQKKVSTQESKSNRKRIDKTIFKSFQLCISSAEQALWVHMIFQLQALHNSICVEVWCECTFISTSSYHFQSTFYHRGLNWNSFEPRQKSKSLRKKCRWINIENICAMNLYNLKVLHKLWHQLQKSTPTRSIQCDHMILTHGITQLFMAN